jgi:hypothetical protein
MGENLISGFLQFSGRSMRIKKSTFYINISVCYLFDNYRKSSVQFLRYNIHLLNKI